jgi:catechol 2,3-dioxygenase-like lactoylglutathione lyase family enzyme
VRRDQTHALNSPKNEMCRDRNTWRNTPLAPRRKYVHDGRMTQQLGLSRYNIIGFVTIVDVARAKSFYGDTLGLRLVSEEPPFALVFDANGIMLRLGMGKEVPPASGTVLGWQVADITNVVQDLMASGVGFERYDFLQQDDSGIWTSPTGARVAWFKDPDGNLLSVSEHPEGK